MQKRKTLSSVSDILHENNLVAAKTRRFFIWMPMNIMFLSFLLHDIWNHQRSNTFILMLEHAAASVVSLNILYFCCQRFLSPYFRKKCSISFRQYNVLCGLYNGIKDNKNSLNVVPDPPVKVHSKRQKIFFEQFRVSTSPVIENSNPPSKADFATDNLKLDKFNIKSHHISPTTSFLGSSSVVDSSFESSFHNTSANYFRGSTSYYDGFGSRSLNSSNFSVFGKNESVDEVDNLRKSFNDVELKYLQNTSCDFIHNWKSRECTLYRSQSIQRSDIVLNDVYQLSPTAALESVKPVNEVSSLGANPVICKKFGINPAYLSEWIANLRMWTSQTILARIIKEIQHVNSALSSYGVSNISIGNSGIERLKKITAMSHISQNIPSLSSLISFLDVSANQEYVVQRINALSTGSMSNYSWNSGGAYEGKPWNESLPTDAALMMHLISAYFDSQLFPLPHTAPDGRQFSSAHYVKTPAVPVKNKKSLIIYQQRINPPHFQLIIGEEIYDISRGRNNLFHVLLFFLQHIKVKESGMFEHVNLGSSGINMLWIIKDPSHNLYKKT